MGGQAGQKFQIEVIAPGVALVHTTVFRDGVVGRIFGINAVQQYRRTVQLTENCLQMQDVTDYPGEIVLTLMSEEKPEATGAVVRFGTRAQMTVKGAGRITTEEIPITMTACIWPGRAAFTAPGSGSKRRSIFASVTAINRNTAIFQCET